MKCKERYIARLDEVKITREGDYAFIEYKEEGVPSTRLENERVGATPITTAVGRAQTAGVKQVKSPR